MEQEAETATIGGRRAVDYKKPLGQAANEAGRTRHDRRGPDGPAGPTAVAGGAGLRQRAGADRAAAGFHLPAADRAKMATMVQFEAKRHVPDRLEQLAWDFQVLAEGERTGSPRPKRPPQGLAVPVLFAAARRKLLQQAAGR